MNKTVLGIFSTQEQAANTLEDLQANGYDPKDISVIMQDTRNIPEKHEDLGERVTKDTVGGAATGGVIGGITGLLIGVGAITIPGIGILLIGGPIAAALGLTGAAAAAVSGAITGILAGGLVGALVGIGVPEETAKVYEKHVREGAILMAVPAKKNREEEIERILANNGAKEIKTITVSDYKQD